MDFQCYTHFNQTETETLNLSNRESHFLSNDSNKVKIFKTYNNKLNKIRKQQKNIILGPNLVY